MSKLLTTGPWHKCGSIRAGLSGQILAYVSVRRWIGGDRSIGNFGRLRWFGGTTGKSCNQFNSHLDAAERVLSLEGRGVQAAIEILSVQIKQSTHFNYGFYL